MPPSPAAASSIAVWHGRLVGDVAGDGERPGARPPSRRRRAGPRAGRAAPPRAPRWPRPTPMQRPSPLDAPTTTVRTILCPPSSVSSSIATQNSPRRRAMPTMDRDRPGLSLAASPLVTWNMRLTPPVVPSSTKTPFHCEASHMFGPSPSKSMPRPGLAIRRGSEPYSSGSIMTISPLPPVNVQVDIQIERPSHPQHPMNFSGLLSSNGERSISRTTVLVWRSSAASLA